MVMLCLYGKPKKVILNKVGKRDRTQHKLNGGIMRTHTVPSSVEVHHQYRHL